MGTELTLPRMAGASNIMVGWICPGDVTNRFASALADTLIADEKLRRIRGKVSLQSSPRIVQARTDMVEAFLSTELEWLLMIDADMYWEYPDFDRLCRAADKDKRPIIGGLCFGGAKGQMFPTLYDIKIDEDGQIDSTTIRDYPKNKVVEVSATGAAFLLVHRRVFIRMINAFDQNGTNPYPWFNEVISRGRALGEDVAFCVRATSIDFKVHVHTGVRIGHEKRHLLTEEMYLDDNL